MAIATVATWNVNFLQANGIPDKITVKMKTKFKLILSSLLIVCIFIGCNDSNTGSKDGFLKRYSLRGKLYDEDIVMQPIGLFATDSMLVIVSPHVYNGFGQIFNLNNDLEKVGEFGNIGNGPSEFIYPEPTFAGDNYFYIQNVNARGKTFRLFICEWQLLCFFGNEYTLYSIL